MARQFLDTPHNPHGRRLGVGSWGSCGYSRGHEVASGPLTRPQNGSRPQWAIMSSGPRERGRAHLCFSCPSCPILGLFLFLHQTSDIRRIPIVLRSPHVCHQPVHCQSSATYQAYVGRLAKCRHGRADRQIGQHHVPQVPQQQMGDLRQEVQGPKSRAGGISNNWPTNRQPRGAD